ncbi:MAG: polysaccharide pyruvyl transferase family protein [Lachnospiraceae bacterium]|nr:polysaccharide pyruvyl transferase family protein [Lachnospiraceae bacterium]
MKRIVGRKCTGCGACYNICPQNAIIMKEDEEGFLYPEIQEDKCIHCGVCEKICPTLHPVYENNQDADCYAMMASDELRKNSSSGAFVPLVAEWIFEQGGVVYGAAWREDWSVHHIRVDNIEELYKIKSSKYMQSDIELCYQDAKKQLESGKWVLFTGTPCQIAGLYAFLGNKKDNKQLITIDIICHGTPSYKVFNKYLCDNYDVKKIKKIDFRDKSVFGWSTCQNIYFDSNEIVRINNKKDTFFQGFLPCLFNRPSCSTCQFNKLPRQGNVTVGDFWGVEQYDRAFDDRLGTSAVIVNNVKGEKIVELLSSRMKLWKKVSIESITKINKTVLHAYKDHSGRKHFYSAFTLKPFNQLVNDSLNHHYDIGVVGLWYGINYGSILTYYALYSLLHDLGYDAVMLPKPNHLWKDVTERFDDANSIAQKFIWRHCNVFLKCGCQEEYTRFNDRCTDFIIGSDVVWKYSVCGKDTDQFFFLDWVEEGHKKIAYAASFGNGLEGTEEYKTKARYYLNQFDAVSIRETYGADVAKKECKRSDIEQVLDPVFVCNSDIYYKVIAESSVNINKKFIFVYMLNVSNANKKEKVLQDISKLKQEEVIFCGNPNAIERMKSIYNGVLENTPSVEDWLAYIQNCSFYMGDSYHGLCFALIFHKPFVILAGESVVSFSEQRFISLLELVDLKERFITNLDDLSYIQNLCNEEIDWNYVDARLAENKDRSINWLKSALRKETRCLDAKECITDSYVRKMNDKVAELEQRLEQQQNILTNVINRQQAEEQIKDSLSYRIGRSITWIPRKVKRVLKVRKLK